MYGGVIVIFPPSEYSAKHLRLICDLCQEPMAATPFNWDTAALRKAGGQ